MEPSRFLIRHALRAFSLVELMVVVAIISTVTIIALLGQSNFDRTMLLTDAAYSVALSAREMQTFGVSSRGFDTDSGPGVSVATNIAYGLFVQTASPSSYLLYADTSRSGGAPLSNCPTGTNSTSPEYKRGNCLYDTTAPADGIVQNYTFGRGFRISSICGKSGAATYCSTDSSNPLLSIDVAYMRPNTDTAITGKRQGIGTPTPLTSAQVYISTANGSATRGICFSQIGQVSVVTGTCP